MSNISFLNFPGFAESTRYEHSIGTGYLALRLSEQWRLSPRDTYEFVIAALFHDVATPPFGHVTESVYKQEFGFDHEEMTAWIILGKASKFMKTSMEPIFAGEGPKLRSSLRSLPEKVDPENVFQYVSGKGKFGRMIKGSIDLDNIDNVVRSAFHVGLPVDKGLPFKLVDSFDIGSDGSIGFRYENSYLLQEWLNVRRQLYAHLLLDTCDLARECMLRYAIEEAVQLGLLKEWHWRMTDVELISFLTNVASIEAAEKKGFKEIARIINGMRLSHTLRELGLYWIVSPDFYRAFQENPVVHRSLEKDLTELLKARVIVYIVPDKTSRAIDDFKLTPRGPLLGQAKTADIGERPTNLLVCVYSVQPTLVKRDEQGKPILSDDHSQQKYNARELREIVLQYLRDRMGYPQYVSVFEPECLSTE
jgi:HD superfamily phosphohydrolase